MFGYHPADVDLSVLAVAPDPVSIGDSVHVSFEMSNRVDRPQRLMIDLVVGFVKSNGSVSPKVFKFKDVELDAAATQSFSKKLDMIVRNTRPLYPGQHTVAVRVNGTDLASATFDLTA